MKRYPIVAAVAFLACIVAANWAVQRYGLIWGVLAAVPAGTYFAGLTFTFRDIVHDGFGRRWVVALIVVGGLLSYLVAPSFAFASGVAFLVSETADLVVYEPLRKRRWETAVIASNAVGSLVDTWIFLSLADLPLSGKSIAAVVLTKWLVTLPVLGLLSLRRERLAA